MFFQIINNYQSNLVIQEVIYKMENHNTNNKDNDDGNNNYYYYFNKKQNKTDMSYKYLNLFQNLN